MFKNKNIFFSSDWHIGHTNSIIFDNRPFKDLEHMHRVLINNYNSCVKQNDICYFLGDMVFCKESTKNVLSKLNGTKVIIVGNHDPGYNSLYNLGFDVAMHQATIFLGKNKITLSHCPLLGVYREDTSNMIGGVPGSNWHGEHKHQKFSVENSGQFHIHGHIHSPNKGRSVKILDRQFDVGVPSNNYTPVSLSEIESWINLSLK
jgi:calcineurin-like phosphoesterase family protein